MRTQTPFRCFSYALALALILAAASCGPAGGPKQTPLDEYVAAPDPSFAFDETPASVVEGEGFTAKVYKMTSQTWLDSSKVDKPEWEHWVTVIVPDEREQTEALLTIGGGNNKRTEPPQPNDQLGQIAVLTKSILVDLGQIPSEPLVFPDEADERYKEKGRTEDEIIAYAWDKYLVTGDPLWLPRLPMTKAAVRAMDLVQQTEPEVDGFVVVGGSKRGWTTWTTGAVDPRVVAIVPASIDVLNVVQNLDNHWGAYGFWAPAIKDYEDAKVLARIHTPEFQAMMDIVDPHSYVDRLTMPKYIVNSTGDQFFPPDSSQFYFDDLKGESYLRYVPNTDHGLNMEAYFNLASFHYAVTNDIPRPKFEWRFEPDGSITVDCETEPTAVLLWQASNPDARDFRRETIGEAWESSPLEGDANGVYQASVAAPEKGWTAFLIELEFPCEGFSFPLKFTTGVSVVPDTLPHKDTPQPQ